MNRDDDSKATEVGEAVDALLHGREPGLDDPAVVAARRIRASMAPPPLGPERVRTLAATVAGQWAWRRRRRTLQAVVAIAAAIVLVVLASVVLRGRASLPERLRSRETAELLPGPFPEDQTASDRIDVIYADRLGSYRELGLAPRASRARTEATLAGVLP